jgi:ParB family chromosome partitioning protein
MSQPPKRGLGRGLGALIPGPPVPLGAPPAATGAGAVLDVALDAIVPNPRQPRMTMPEDDLAALAVSIQEHGIIQPLVVSRVEGGYQLIAGERRWRAAQRAGLASVPVLVKEVTPQGLLELALVENVQRADLNPLEEALAYRQLMDEFGLTQEQVAQRVGKSRVAVSNTVRLLALDDQVKEALIQGLISEGHARALLGLGNPEGQVAALQTVIAREYTVRQTEDLVRRLLGERPARAEGDSLEPEPEVRALQQRLVEHLGTKVRLQRGRRGGSLVIRFFSDEELNAVCDRILGPGWDQQ